MAWHTDRVNVLKVITIPDGIPEGVVIGRGGCHSKWITATFHVRCKVQRGERTVFVEGSREGVESATQYIHELIDQARAEREQDSTHRDGGSGVPAKTIHTVAVVKHSDHSTWRFEVRDEESINEDTSVESFAYHLVEIPAAGTAVGHDTADDGPLRWLTAFDANFKQRMAREVLSTPSDDPASIKIKIAFGLQCFSLPDEELVDRVFSWEELRALDLYTQVKPRWCNMLNFQSDALASLLDKLEAQFGETTVFKTELVAYVNKRQGTRGDISIKFGWEHGEWVLVERDPIRVAYALYNIALDNETAFRVRVYSRQEAPQSLDYSELVDSLEITTTSDRDPFSTTVNMRNGLPAGLFLRSFAVRETAVVVAHGLRFTISYSDAKRKTASVSCRLPDDDSTPPADAIGSLVERVVAILTKP